MSERTIDGPKLELAEAGDRGFPPKSEWGPGPWQDEPDRLEFEHLGFPCLIRRNMGHGTLCGYVAVPPGHPWHGRTPDEAEVHGGFTYGGLCDGDICHIPKPGEPDDVFWLGFDCGHAWDVSPGLDALLERDMPGDLKPSTLKHRLSAPAILRAKYRTIAYVREQCERLAEQAKAAAT